MMTDNTTRTDRPFAALRDRVRALVPARWGKPAVVAGAMLGLSACAYPGYYGDGHVNGASSSYACDPYAPFDDYYACDNSYGFVNIGFGGGWYDDFYYPGYGVSVFDRYGSRYAMRGGLRRYWARQRALYGARSYRGNRGYYGDRRYDRNERRAERRERRAERRADWTPEQRQEFRERRAERRERRADWTPAERREFRERRQERRAERRGSGIRNARPVVRRDSTVRGDRRQARRAERRANRPAMAQDRAQQARPRRAAPVQARPVRARPEPAPVARSPRAAPRVSPRAPATVRRNVVDE